VTRAVARHGSVVPGRLPRWPAGVALLALAGCASVAPVGPPPLSGRLSLQVAADGQAPARGVNAAFELSGDARQGELRLASPLGPQFAAARWSPGQATLDSGRGVRRFDDVDTLLREALGEPLPLPALFDWLRGRPWPGAPSTATADGFQQLGWGLDLARWNEGFVTAHRSTPPAVTLRVRLDTP
jgi:outer membrane lipoprotein LolB